MKVPTRHPHIATSTTCTATPTGSLDHYPERSLKKRHQNMAHHRIPRRPAFGWKRDALSFQFASIIAVLSMWQDQPLSKWPLPVSINVIISILSAIFKASLILPVSEGISQLKWIWFASGRRPLSDLDVFDRASRGSWGSFRLLTAAVWGPFRSQQGGSPRVLASLGAFVVLVAIATDPFSQALI
jgi:hypothetical protein